MEIGNYGGTMRLVTSVVNWDADGFIGNNEALLTMESTSSDVITPNIVESYEVSDDQTTFTFTLRNGLKWSDGMVNISDEYDDGMRDALLRKCFSENIAVFATGIFADMKKDANMCISGCIRKTLKMPGVKVALAGIRTIVDLDNLLCESCA
ncbi:MAG: hypothetical protein IJC56_04935 [Clostridia bacterium]|nr:hypothetical protein [Clostridia bacterium]